MPWRAVTIGLFIGSLGAGAVLLRAHRERAPVVPPAFTTVVEAMEAPEQEGAPEAKLAALGDVVGALPEPPAEPLAPPAEPVPPEPPSPHKLSPDGMLAALSKETVVYEKPSRSSRKLGYLRTGAFVNRAAVPISRENCSEGWYRVAPEGYVCVGRTATLDLEHPTVLMASLRPDRSAPMPYVYGKTLGVGPPYYSRLPSPAEQQTAEKDLAGHLRKGFDAPWRAEAVGPPPAQIAGGERIPRPFGYPVLPRDYLIGYGLANSSFAFIDLFEAEGRRWGITTDLTLVPLDRLRPIKPSEFHGVVLGETMQLPIVFVRSQRALLYGGDPDEGTLHPEGPAGYREAFALTGRKARVGSEDYLETRSGQWLRDQHLVRIDPPEQLPHWAKNRRTWIDISILNQYLVAYEGPTPVYATLVSTGRDGVADPKTSRATARGAFLIHTKHVTSTMSSDEPGDEFDLRDIPYVQYFHEGYALHAAFWHDSFGSPRSHGCVNLSPLDARWLFSWTEPPVPQQWHTALSNQGTLVHVRP